jgi:TrmH family RNA methyltransferase
MLTITSSQNPRVKEAVRLRDRKHREKQQRILIDGARELRRAIQAGVPMLEIFVCDSLCRGDEAEALLPRLESCGGEVLKVSESVFEKLAFGHRTEGVLGVAQMPRPTLDSLMVAKDFCATSNAASVAKASANASAVSQRHPLVAVIEGVEKPGNVGAVLRSADAAGVSAVIVTDAGTDLFNPNAIRASMGTIFTVPVCEASNADALAWLREKHFTIAAARVDGSVPYTEVDYRGPTALVLGSEAQGLSSTWNGDDIRAIRLPMLGVADSLNVSVTAAVLFYEALRQRGTRG